MSHRFWLTLLLSFTLTGSASSYIAVSAERLTLSEVILEFPNVVVLTLDKFDATKGAYLFKVTETLHGKPPSNPVKYALLSDGKLPTRFAGLKIGDTMVTFLGSVDNRTITFSSAGWFVTRPDQGWERLNSFRDDFAAMFTGSPTDMADAVRSLAQGGEVIVSVTSTRRSCAGVPSIHPELFQVLMDGKSEQLTRSAAGGLRYHPQPLPDGKWLLFGSKRENVRQLILLRLSDRVEQPLTRLKPGHAAMWAHWQPVSNPK